MGRANAKILHEILESGDTCPGFLLLPVSATSSCVTAASAASLRCAAGSDVCRLQSQCRRGPASRASNHDALEDRAGQARPPAFREVPPGRAA